MYVPSVTGYNGNIIIEEECTMENSKKEVREGSTGSIAQDAMRAGFQLTCRKGIAKLLKVDDITVEQCNQFRPRHEERVKENIEAIKYKYNNYINNYVKDFKSNLIDCYMGPFDTMIEGIDAIGRFFSIPFYWIKVKYMKVVGPKGFSINVGETTSDITYGSLSTDIKVTLEFEDEKLNKTDTITVTTHTNVGEVGYIPYEDYKDSYIPDEAIEVVKEAIKIGLTNIKIAYPRVSNGNPYRDPIIVGYNKNDMYILVWFGYDKKQPYSCNM